jgi:hypothetical protein
MIDGFVHHEGDARDALQANREAIEQMLDAEPKEAPVYTELDAMTRRVTQATDQSWDAAATLVARGHKPGAEIGRRAGHAPPYTRSV